MAAPLILARTFKDAHAFAQEKLGLRIGYYRVVNSAGTIKAVRGVDLYLVPGWNKRPDRFTMGSAIRWCRLNVIDVEKQPVEPEPTDERWANTAYTQTIATRFHLIHFIQHRTPRWTVTAVPDDFPVPQSHTDLVARVLPQSDPFTAFLTAGVEPEAPEPVAICVDCGLDPHAPDCASNTLETEFRQRMSPEGQEATKAAATEVIADMLDTPEPEAPKKNRRRRKCAECGSLHFKGDPCIESEDA